MSNNIHVQDNAAAGRFEAVVDGHLALIRYQLLGKAIMLIHTEVPDELQGQGIGAQMARAALNHARAEGLKVIPRCPYVAGYIKKHPEYQDLVL